ncbi:MAG: hypothetical protein S4CHLAM20_05960 [Chlamydiia bacterium]|nr:hypothetical protein [Chlamydiia bacterium]
MKIKRRHPLTIIEIMIVIFIISIVGGVMSYNMKGSLVKGRVFKSEAASKEAYDILSLEMASGSTLERVLSNPESVLKESGLVKNPKKILEDGWGKKFQLLQTEDDDFILYSKEWTQYLIKDKKMKPKEIQEEYPWAYNRKVVNEAEATS